MSFNPKSVHHIQDKISTHVQEGNGKIVKVDSLIGKRIRLIEMFNDPLPIPSGSMGTVRDVNRKTGQIDVAWDNKRGLYMLIGVDKWEVIT
ncbi:MAG: hypothetical protein CL489_17990 [Acidobacteria bacterium]|nr:hypothetical protein [Acidobacteriota bacterium]